MGGMTDRGRLLLDQFLWALDGPGPITGVELAAGGSLPSVFAVSDLAQASVGAAGAACARLVALGGGTAPTVVVDRDLASAWFGFSIRPEGWELPSVWDAVAGDYSAADGWIKLHTNAPHHRAAALTVLGVPGDRDSVAGAVATWAADDLEAAVVGAGGAAAALRSGAAWDAHPQGRAVAGEPLVHRDTTSATTGGPSWTARAERPLARLRVLDLTRVLAGPVATRLARRVGCTGPADRPAGLGRARRRARGHARQAVRPPRPHHARRSGPLPRVAGGRRRPRPRLPGRRTRGSRARVRPAGRHPARPGRRQSRRLWLVGSVDDGAGSTASCR